MTSESTKNADVARSTVFGGVLIGGPAAIVPSDAIAKNDPAPDLGRKLQELLDKDAIRDLAIKYCHLVCAREVDKIVDLYSRHAAEFAVPSGLEKGVSGQHDDPEAIRAAVQAGLRLYQPWPFAHNHLIELISEDTAQGWVHAEVRFGTHNLETCELAAYEDDYIKEDGSWKFKNRKVNITFLKILDAHNAEENR